MPQAKTERKCNVEDARQGDRWLEDVAIHKDEGFLLYALGSKFHGGWICFSIIPLSLCCTKSVQVLLPDGTAHISLKH